MQAIAGTEWEDLLPVPDRRPTYIPVEYTNKELQREGYNTACPHPDLEKAIIERMIQYWNQKLETGSTFEAKKYYQGRLQYYTTWNRDWMQRFGNFDNYGSLNVTNTQPGRSRFFGRKI